jgi:hypothetical protein
MQGTSQLIWSNQKRLEYVWHIREAITNGTSILTDQEVGQIKEQAALLGEDGGAMVGKILNQVKELAGQPADVLKMVEGHLKELSKRLALRELYVELEKERAEERTAQLKVMEAEVDKLRATLKRGDMTDIAKGYSILRDQLDEYLEGLEADKEGDLVTSDPSGTWHEAATNLTKEILVKVSPYMRTMASEKEDALGPLRRVMGKVADLNEAIGRVEDAPVEERLMALGRELSQVKRELMLLGRVLMMSQDLSLATGAHKLAGEAEDAIRAGQLKVTAAL